MSLLKRFGFILLVLRLCPPCVADVQSAEEVNSPQKIGALLRLDENREIVSVTEIFKLQNLQIIEYRLPISESVEPSQLCYSHPSKEITGKVEGILSNMDIGGGHSSHCDFFDSSTQKVLLIRYAPSYVAISSWQSALRDSSQSETLEQMMKVLPSAQSSSCKVLLSDKHNHGLINHIAATLQAYALILGSDPIAAGLTRAVKRLAVEHEAFPENENALVRRDFILTIPYDGSDLVVNWLQQGLHDPDPDVVFASLLKIDGLPKAQKTKALRQQVSETRNRWQQKKNGGELALSFNFEYPVSTLAACVLNRWDSEAKNLYLGKCQ